MAKKYLKINIYHFKNELIKKFNILNIKINTDYLAHSPNKKHIIIVVKGVIKLKKERNCGGYPIYPNMGGMPMPIYPNMMPGMMPLSMYNTDMGNDLSSLNSKINNLEQRVTALESSLNKTYSNSYNTNYNTSNYQMM